jgi:hypothetical protein
VGVVFLVVSVLRAAGPKLDYLPEDPRGNAGYWELFGLAFAIAGAAVLASTLIKIRVRREG